MFVPETDCVCDTHPHPNRQTDTAAKVKTAFVIPPATVDVCTHTHTHTNKCKVVTASRQTKRGLFCLEWPSSETVSRSHCLCHWGMFGAESVHCFYQSFSRTSLIEKECAILWEKRSKQKGEQMKQRQQMFGACWRRDRRVLSNFKRWGEVFLTGCNSNNGVRLFISLILLGLLFFF